MIYNKETKLWEIDSKIFLTDEGYEEYALGRFVEIAMEG